MIRAEGTSSPEHSGLSSVAVRAAAIDRIAEVDLVKAIAAKCQVPAVRAAAKKRLESIYATELDREMADVSPVVNAYAKRLREKQK